MADETAPDSTPNVMTVLFMGRSSFALHSSVPAAALSSSVRVISTDHSQNSSNQAIGMLIFAFKE
jgi:hypothetical protein